MRLMLPLAVALLLCSVGCRPTEKPPARPGEEPIELTDANFQELVLDGKQPVMVDVYSTDCLPCRKMAPLVAELASEFKGRAVVGKLDANASQTVAQKYDIEYVPTFLFFRNGELVDRKQAATSKQDLAERLEKLLDR